MQVCPLIFEPIYKRRIWGGQRLGEALDKALPAGETIGESWELADLPQDQSVVASGPARGRQLGDLVHEWGRSLIGNAPLFQGSFPLLIKFLDAQEDLSVQVHPDEAMVRELGGGVRLKHEAWYVIDCSPGAVIFKGLRAGVSREDFSRAVRQGNCADLLRRIEVKQGQCHYLPSGTVHALGAGVLVAEIQTPSDVTYRVFDWNRIDPKTGERRALHVDRALKCIHYGAPDDAAQRRSHTASYWTTVTRLVTCESFIIEKVRMVAGLEQRIPYAEPVVWIVLSGRGRVIYGPAHAEQSFSKGDTMLLPAALPEGRVRLDEDSVWLEVTIPIESDLAGYERPSRAYLQAEPGSLLDPIHLNIRRNQG